MAEVTGLRNNALPYPIYGAPFGIVLPILDADGDPVTGAASLDSEISKNGDTPSDCTNEATEIGSSGTYYLLLTGTELTADVAAGVTKTATSGAKTTPWVLYPRKLVTVRSGTAASAGSATDSIVLDSGASDQDDYYNGMVVIATIDSNVEARVISDYVGSTKTASVVPDWNVAPDNNDTFIIKLPEGMQVPTLQAITEDALKRDWTGMTGEAARSMLNALRFIRNKWSISGGTLTVTKENDTTSAWTAAVTTDAAADPIIGNDPA